MWTIYTTTSEQAAEYFFDDKKEFTSVLRDEVTKANLRTECTTIICAHEGKIVGRIFRPAKKKTVLKDG